jgi:hypothetical protein
MAGNISGFHPPFKQIFAGRQEFFAFFWRRSLAATQVAEVVCAAADGILRIKLSLAE